MQVLGCVFRNPATSASPGNFVALGSCLSSVVDGCYFDGGADAGKRPKGGVVFNNSALSRVSNCTGYRLLDQLAWVDAISRDCVEYGNSEVEQIATGSPVRIKLDASRMRFVGSSRRGLSAPGMNPNLPADTLPAAGEAQSGALLWNELLGKLQTWDGVAWKSVNTV
jgi:hypothetical protein